MKIVFLGTGPSLGIPVPTCDCKTCQSTDARDKRLRSSLYVELENRSFIIDSGPDFRQQVLRENIRHIDFILLTHKHNDHIGGLDDIRPFNYSQNNAIPLYGNHDTLHDIKKRFYYSFEQRPYPGTPKFELHEVKKDTKFEVKDIEITPIELFHGKMPVFGYRFGDFTYITDAKYIHEDQRELIKGSKYLVVNVLRPYREHKMHFNLKEALQLIEEIAPEKAFLTHLSHKFPPYKELNKLVPENVVFAYDGLTLML